MDLTITLILLLTESKLKISNNSNLKKRLKNVLIPIWLCTSWNLGVYQSFHSRMSGVVLSPAHTQSLKIIGSTPPHPISPWRAPQSSSPFKEKSRGWIISTHMMEKSGFTWFGDSAPRCWHEGRTGNRQRKAEVRPNLLTTETFA